MPQSPSNTSVGSACDRLPSGVVIGGVLSRVDPGVRTQRGGQGSFWESVRQTPGDCRSYPCDSRGLETRLEIETASSIYRCTPFSTDSHGYHAPSRLPRMPHREPGI